MSPTLFAADFPRRGMARGWPSCAFIAIILLPLIALGHDSRRVAQLMVLALPVLVWLAWPVRSTWVHHLRSAVAWFWLMAFALDGVARAYLLDAYGAAPDGAMVLGAVANTTVHESSEYLWMNWLSMAIGVALMLAAGLLFAYGVQGGARGNVQSRWLRRLLCLLIVVSLLAFASKPWRRLHPFVFWSTWIHSVQTLRSSWGDQQRTHELALAQAKALQPSVVRDGPATVMLVISESINRDNMGLYGYGRATTPRLLAQKAQLDDRMLVLENAWSVDASTLPAIRNIFHFGLPEEQNPPHLLALARVAGYKTWWISNQDDMAIEQTHARLADVVEMLNRTPGRASASLDGKILDRVKDALHDAAAHKLIVVHLIGAHPHYPLRFPEGANPFEEGVDAVETEMRNKGRSAWVRNVRREYDAAVLYQDFVVSELLRMSRDTPNPDAGSGFRAWMYLSDHGQEVGHESNRAGHSPSTASGYRIPTVIWRDPAPQSARPDLATQPFRSDWTGWVVTDLLGLHWSADQASRNLLNDAYVWQAPKLPATVPSFSR